MGTHNICLYKEVDKKYTGCNLKTGIDCALIRACGVIRSNMVYMVYTFYTLFTLIIWTILVLKFEQSILLLGVSKTLDEWQTE